MYGFSYKILNSEFEEQELKNGNSEFNDIYFPVMNFWLSVQPSELGLCTAKIVKKLQ